jgi:hypothetical protein
VYSVSLVLVHSPALSFAPQGITSRRGRNKKRLMVAA